MFERRSCARSHGDNCKEKRCGFLQTVVSVDASADNEQQAFFFLFSDSFCRLVAKLRERERSKTPETNVTD